MASYECPSCSGGFPELPPNKKCPWCNQPIDGSYGTPELGLNTSQGPFQSDLSHEPIFDEWKPDISERRQYDGNE